MTKKERERLEAAERMIDAAVEGRVKIKNVTQAKQFFGEYRFMFPKQEKKEDDKFTGMGKVR